MYVCVCILFVLFCLGGLVLLVGRGVLFLYTLKEEQKEKKYRDLVALYQQVDIGIRVFVSCWLDSMDLSVGQCSNSVQKQNWEENTVTFFQSG